MTKDQTAEPMNCPGQGRHAQSGVSMPFLLVMGGLLIVSVLVLGPIFQPPRPRHLTYTPKANMHTLQTIVETYAVDSKGIYPANIAELSKAARKPGFEYWKDFQNPVTFESGYMRSYQDEGQPPIPGIVTYQPIHTTKGRFRSYRIYGYDEKGGRMQYKGRDFVLSNE
ncbi:MAG TPA: hypothetical protein V6D23_17500 [Candidatus Obscuribacterales bacterium]